MNSIFDPTRMETMRLSAKTTIIIITLLCSLPLHAWKLFPLVSYSSSSGVLLGGVVNNNMIPPFEPFGFSSIAILFPAGGGLITFNANYYVIKKDKFFGWGNGGDDELYEYFNAEVQDISGSYHFSPISGLVMTGGLLCRHSTVYNRSDDLFWRQSPTDEYASQWTAGPHIAGNWSFPAFFDGYLSAGYTLQLGGWIPYSSSECAMSVFTPIGSSTTPAFRMKVERHMGTSSTSLSLLTRTTL
jgi:hypothetical protein